MKTIITFGFEKQSERLSQLTIIFSVLIRIIVEIIFGIVFTLLLQIFTGFKTADGPLF